MNRLIVVIAAVPIGTRNHLAIKIEIDLFLYFGPAVQQGDFKALTRVTWFWPHSVVETARCRFGEERSQRRRVEIQCIACRVIGQSQTMIRCQEQADQFDVVVNATSAGLKGESPPFPSSCLNSSSFCYDLTYSLKQTPFVEWANDQGAGRAVQGWGMLIEQAAESFAIWRGVRPDTAPLLRQLVTR